MIRTLSMDAVQAAGSGHPGLPMAIAPVAQHSPRPGSFNRYQAGFNVHWGVREHAVARP